MAKISAKKSNLKNIANKIVVSPSTAAVSDLKFKRKKDFSTFVKWIESSNKSLAGIALPSKQEVGGSKKNNNLIWILAILGLLASLKPKNPKVDGDGSTGIKGSENAGVTIPKPLQGPNLTSALDITRQLNNPRIRQNNKNSRINRKNSRINKKTIRNNLKKRFNLNKLRKNSKSNSLKNFGKGVKPRVTNLGNITRNIFEPDKGKFSAKPGKAPLVPDSLSKGTIPKKPILKTNFKSNLKNLLKPKNFKNLGKGLMADFAAQKLIVEPVDHLMTKGFRHMGKGLLDKQVTKHGAPKVLSRLMERKEKLVSKKPVNWAVEMFTGRNELNQKFLKEIEFDIDYIKTKYKDQLNNELSSIKSGGEVTVPFPVITDTSKSGSQIIPVPIGTSGGSSSSIASSSSGGVNTLEDLLLTRL